MDFFNFFLLYILLAMMFAIVGNINFIYDLNEFDNFTDSFLTVIDASLGNFDTAIFLSIPDHSMQLIGEVYMISIIVVFNILLMNLIIAILANTYNTFDSRSNGLYLSKILITRDELNYDKSYGAILSATPPINAIQVPFVPAFLFLRYNTPQVHMVNSLVMRIQYVLFMIVLKAFFCAISVLLIPIAWLIGCVDKIKSLHNQPNFHTALMNNYLWFPFGMLILSADVVADGYWFWKNMFRLDLKQIIIPKEVSTITHKSIRELMQMEKMYADNKIKCVRCSGLIKTFRTRFSVNQNIQFLIFGQLIPVGGFRQSHMMQKMQTQYTSMRTNDLKDVRLDEIQRLDDTDQYISSKHQLQQFNMLKKILVNFSFRDKGKHILVSDINWDVIDELRKERKIFMVLRDKGVDQYINMKMTEVDLYDEESHADYELDLKRAIEEKLEFRSGLAEKISITRLDYMIRMLRITGEGKYTISDPDTFKEKVKELERRERRRAKADLEGQDEFGRMKSTSSLGSSKFDQSQKTGLSSEYSSKGGSTNGDDSDDENMDGLTGVTRDIQSDPIYMALNLLFSTISEEVTEAGISR